MIPENLQDRNVRRFKGFTPQQVEKLLAGKGFKPNSREAAEYLGAMAERAEEMLQKVKPMKAYQGASVGGFDDRSRKLFDAAVKRSAGTDPKSPEVQRYLDNVIDTRGRPTMVFPGTADPLQGYQMGGMPISDISKTVLASPVGEQIRTPTKEQREELNRLGDMERRKVQVAGDSQSIRQKELENLSDLTKVKQATPERPNPYGIHEPTGLPAGPDGLPITHSEATYFPGLNKVLSFDRLTGQYSDGKGNFYEGKLGEEPTLAQYKPPPNPFKDFPGFFPSPGIPQNPNLRDPLPDKGSPNTQKTALDTAQANLANAEKELSDLQQQLATIPLEDEAKRNAIIEQINQQQPKITAAQSALASASGQFQTVSVPTAAEAVGSTVSTPQDVITRQPVDLMREEAGQTITAGTGKLTGDITPTKTIGEATTVGDVDVSPAALSDVTTTVRDVRAYTPQERFGQISQDAIIKAQQVATEDLNIRNVEAAQGTGQQIISPSKRALQQGELVSGAANAEQSAQFLEGIEAATGAPSSAATVQGQLTNLMTQFEGGTPPPWAAGAMRQATAIMAQRGMAASSMAGQAIVQAAMESALPIALQDAQTVAQFEAQNLSNRQQRAMLAAQQRATFLGMEFDQEFQARVQNASKISDIANLNFSAEQQIALENAQLAQTVDLANLSNRQAVTMAQASAIAQADMANLNNRQQAAVQNAQNFLQMDFRNLDISQQNDMFKNQSVIQSIFTDAAAQNASSQFNATSQNQTNQFFASLKTQVGQFNASQTNAMEQYNVGQLNAMEQFQAEIKNQRDQFNAQNALVIAQANAQWRQQLATVNNASLNEANRQNALQANGLTQKGLDEIWQKERDLMAYAFATAESAAERRNQLLINDLKAEAAGDTAFSSALGSFGSAIVSGFFQPSNLKFLFGG
jgi:hypothetical protein